jgi:hypothetical protein
VAEPGAAALVGAEPVVAVPAAELSPAWAELFADLGLPDPIEGREALPTRPADRSPTPAAPTATGARVLAKPLRPESSRSAAFAWLAQTVAGALKMLI